MTKAMTTPLLPPMSPPASMSTAARPPSRTAVFRPLKCWCPCTVPPDWCWQPVQRRAGSGRSRLGDVLEPLAKVEALVHQPGRIGRGVVVGRRPEQRVERAHVDADAAPHAQPEVD